MPLATAASSDVFCKRSAADTLTTSRALRARCCATAAVGWCSLARQRCHNVLTSADARTHLHALGGRNSVSYTHLTLPTICSV
eukprot:15379660-Alexandrium_andersonii.AAC.1